MVLGVFGKVVESNATFDLSDRVEVYLDHMRMPAGKGKRTEKTRGCSLDVNSAIKMYHCFENGSSLSGICTYYRKGSGY